MSSNREISADGFLPVNAPSSKRRRAAQALTTFSLRVIPLSVLAGFLVAPSAFHISTTSSHLFPRFFFCSSVSGRGSQASSASATASGKGKPSLLTDCSMSRCMLILGSVSRDLNGSGGVMVRPMTAVMDPVLRPSRSEPTPLPATEGSSDGESTHVLASDS